eukprot:scaffold1880_cov115-Isochrysis_galbana.AAC.5
MATQSPSPLPGASSTGRNRRSWSRSRFLRLRSGCARMTPAPDSSAQPLSTPAGHCISWYCSSNSDSGGVALWRAKQPLCSRGGCLAGAGAPAAAATSSPITSLP